MHPVCFSSGHEEVMEVPRRSPSSVSTGHVGRGRVRTELPDPVGFVDRVFVGRYSFPRRLRAVAELPSGIEAVVEVEVSDGRARASSVTVRGGGRHGIGWTALAKVPVRDIVATAVLSTLLRTEVAADGTVQLARLEEADALEVRDIIQRVVGYRPQPLAVAEASGAQRRGRRPR
jgi:hypothetical protein